MASHLHSERVGCGLYIVTSSCTAGYHWLQQATASCEWLHHCNWVVAAVNHGNWVVAALTHHHGGVSVFPPAQLEDLQGAVVVGLQNGVDVGLQNDEGGAGEGVGC